MCIRYDQPEFSMLFMFFFYNDTATTEIYTLSLHDALPIPTLSCGRATRCRYPSTPSSAPIPRRDRKSTRLNSSHTVISYAVFCLKKKKKGGLKTTIALALEANLASVSD